MSDKFFLSSVSKEFVYLRKEMHRLLTQYGIEPISMDYAGLPAIPSANNLLQRLESLVEKCAYRVYVVGFSSGWIPETHDRFGEFKPEELSQLSATQLEFLLHLDQKTKKPRFPAFRFVVRENIVRIDGDDNQTAFREWVMANFDYVSIHHPLEALGEIARSPEFIERYRKQNAIVSNLPTIDRDDVCVCAEDLAQKLLDSWKAHLAKPLRDPCHRRILHGPPGIGKTRTAVDFGLRARAGKHFGCSFLVTGNSTEALKASFAGLHVFATSVPPPDENAKIKLVREYLNESTNWLLIMDNIDTPELWHCMKELTSELRDGFVLVTRREELNSRVDDRIRVLPLEMCHAFDYLHGKLDARLYTLTDLTKLPIELWSTPVLLRILREFLAETKIGVDDFLRRLEHSKNALLESKRENDRLLEAAFVHEVMETLPSTQYAELVFASLLSRHPVPLRFVSFAYARSIAKIESSISQQVVPTLPADGSLLSFNLVQLDTARNAIRVHQVIANAVVANLPSELVISLRSAIAADLVVFLESLRIVEFPRPDSLELLSDLMPQVEFLRETTPGFTVGMKAILNAYEIGKQGLPDIEELDRRFTEIDSEIRNANDLRLSQVRDRWETFLRYVVDWWEHFKDALEIARSKSRDIDYSRILDDRHSDARERYLRVRIDATLKIADCLEYEEKPQQIRQMILQVFAVCGDIDLESHLEAVTAKEKTSSETVFERLDERDYHAREAELRQSLQYIPQSEMLIQFLRDAFASLEQYEYAKLCQSLLE